MAEPVLNVSSVAGAVKPDEISTPIAPISQVQVENDTPFQVMLDAALGGLQKVSEMENQANANITNYANGQIGMDEMMMEMAKVSLALELTTSVVNQLVTAFKEVQQMPL